MVRLFVGNIPHAADEVALCKHFQQANFQTVAATIIRDRASGHSRGFGFIELDIPVPDGDTARARMDGTKMQGRRLTVGWAKPKVPRAEHVQKIGAGE